MRNQGSIQVVVIVLLALLLVCGFSYALIQISALRERNSQLSDELAAAHKTPLVVESHAHDEVLATEDQSLPNDQPISPHPLSERTLDRFVYNLKNIDPLRVELDHIVGSSMAFTVAEQIEDGFNQAGWEVERILCVCHPPTRELSLTFHTRPSQRLQDVFSPIFLDIGQEPIISVDSAVPPDTVLVHVGFN